MAIAFIAERANATSAAAGTTLALTMAAGASITPGNTLILEIAYRDGPTPPADVRPQPGASFGAVGGNGELAIDEAGNLWRREAVRAQGGSSPAADNGAVVAIWVCHVTATYINGFAITLRTPTSTPMTHVAARIVEFSGVARVSHPFDFDTAVGNSTTAAVPALSVSTAGQLVYGVASVASNPTLTGDGDATDGAWSAISQDASAAGGIRRGSQYKIVTGTSAQNWAVTWTGTQYWAAAGVVLEAAVVPWPTNNVRLANPNYPCPSGPEIVPVALIQTPVDTGTAYIFETQLPPESSNSSGVYWHANLNTLDPTVDVQHTIVAEVYERGYELLRETPTTLNMGVPWAADLMDGATTTAGTAVAALAAPGGNQVILETGQSVDCYWDFSSLVPYVDRYRVLNLRINYVAWKDDSAAQEPGEGIAVYWRDVDAVSANGPSRITSLHGAWLVNDYNTTAKYVYKNLGEINGLPIIGATSNVEYSNISASFTLNDLIRMNSGDQTTMLSIRGLSGSAPSQETIFLDTIRLEVVVVPEKRLAQSARKVSTGVGFPDGLQGSQGVVNVPLYQATNTRNFWTAPSDVSSISVVLREGVPASPSDWFAAQYDPLNIPANLNGGTYRYASQERVGPSIAMNSVVQPRETLEPQVNVKVSEWTDGQISSGSVPEDQNELIHSFTLQDWNSYYAFWPAYSFINSLDEGVYTGSPGQTIVYTPGDVTFDALKIVVKAPDAEDAPDLLFSVEQPLATVLATATLTREEVLATPEIANGYHEVHVPLSPGAITPASSGNVYVNITSTTPAIDPWVIAVAVDNGDGVSNLGGRSSYQSNPTLSPTTTQDLALVLTCPIPDIDADIASSAITVPGSGTSCVVESSNIPCLTVNNASDYDWLEITRIVNGLDETPLALLNVAEEITYPELLAEDAFDRTVTSGWGTADVGGAWTDTGTAGQFNVSGGVGTITAAANNSNIATLNSVSASDVEVYGEVAFASLATGSTVSAGVLLRGGATPANDNYRLVARLNTTGTVSIRLQGTVAGVSTFSTTVATLPSYVVGSYISLKLRVFGNLLRSKWWMTGSAEPDWQDGGTTGSVLPAGSVGAYYERALGNTSTDPTARFRNFSAYEYVDQPVTWCDYGVPWDLPEDLISYEITGYRDSDRRTTTSDEIFWSDTSVSPGAAFGLATEDGLYAYVPSSDSGALQITWNPLTPLESMPLAGKDYQLALRPAENRGLSITVTVLVNQLAYCTTSESGESGTYDESLPYDSIGMYDFPQGAVPAASRGRSAMAPTAFNQLRSLERVQRVELKLPGGHTRFVFVDVGALSIIPVVGQYMAELTLTDSVPPLTDGAWPE